MDQYTDPNAINQVGLLPALAEKIAEWFPELEGRSIAVSEADITKENIPKLPLAMTAFSKGVSDHSPNSSMRTITITDTIIVEFWLEPSRYKRQNGTETPFWSYYNYEAIRNTLVSRILLWQGPNSERFAYRNLTIEADPLAVILTFTFIANFQWSSNDYPDPDDGGRITDSTFVLQMCRPQSEMCPPEFEEDT